MRTIVAMLLGGTLVAAPVAARADWTGCTLGPTDLNRCTITGAPATAMAAIAAPIIVGGALVSVAHELQKHTEERLPDGVQPASATSPTGKPNLTLVPEPPDPYRAPAGRAETRRKPNPAFEFNEKATNVVTVVAGAAVLGAMIATMAETAKSHK